MELLLTGLGILAGSGLASLLAGRWSRLANVLGAGGAIVGALLGLIPALATLAGCETISGSWAWDVPYGSFSIAMDPLSALFVAIVLGLTATVAVHAAGYLDAYRDRISLGVPWFFFNLMAASMALVPLARNGLLFLVAWEVMSIASYFLVTFYDERPGVLEAGRTYLVATHLGTAFLFVLFILLGHQAGSLDFAAISGRISPGSANLLFLLALVGFGTKAGFMPFHVWLPEAYPVAPSFVSAIMSGAMSKLGIYGLLRILTLMPEVKAGWAWVLIAVGVISAVYGILTGLAQADFKRLLAYSSVENLGLIAMGIGLGLLGISSDTPALTLLGFLGALLHLVNHALFKGLLFLGSGVHRAHDGNVRSESAGGAGPAHAAVRLRDADRLPGDLGSAAVERFRQRVFDLSGLADRPDAVGNWGLGGNAAGDRRRDDFRGAAERSPFRACTASRFSVRRAASRRPMPSRAESGSSRRSRFWRWLAWRPGCSPCHCRNGSCCRSSRRWPIGSWAR